MTVRLPIWSSRRWAAGVTLKSSTSCADVACMPICPTPASPAELAWHSVTDGLAVLDRDGVVTASNAAFAHLVGHADHDLNGLDILDVFAPDEAAAILSASDPSHWAPVAGLASDGFPFLASVNVAPTADGRVVMTARHRFPLIARGPGGTTAHRGDLAEALSHDVRGRLGVVSGFLGLLTEKNGDAPSDDELDCVDRAAAATRTADRMLDRLVHYLRLGEATFNLAPTSLDQVVVDAIPLAGSGMSVRSEPLPVIYADPHLLVECLVELFRNAREFAKIGEPPVISITSRTSGKWCELIVADNGRGIPADLIDDSFGLFRQLQRRDWERGVGMGLPICRRIIDGHGGRITLQRDDVAGTTFVVRLALAPS